ncbi:MAG TPA: hypothetical protein EYN67_19370 [Flavobacteriales bacterium]|nr:hypothetical protein [Flavobacteriales bacterium]
MTALASLVIDLKGNSAHFQKELKKANRKSASFAKKVRANSANVVKSLGAIGAAGAVALGAIYKQSAANIDALAKQADKLGITTQSLSGLHLAAQLTGVSTKALNKGLLDMTVKVQDAAKGMGEGKDALKELGLNALELAKISPDKQFKKISEAMKGVEDHGKKVAIAYDLFGSKGVDLINTLALGEEGLNRTAKEAEALGISLNRVDAAKVEAANDSLLKSSSVFEGIGNSITIGLSPYVNAISDQFYNAALEAGGFGQFTNKAMDVAIKAVGYTANVIRGLQVVWTVVKLAATVAISSMLDGLQSLDIGITNFLNLLPGVEAKTSAFIGGMAGAMKAQITTIRGDLIKLAKEPLPYDGIVAWAEEAKRKSLEAAEIVAAAAAQEGGYSREEAGINDGTKGEGDSKNKNLKLKQDDEQKKVKAHEDKLLKIKANGSKKLAAIQDAIRIKNLLKEKGAQLKIALGDGFVAIQKAWASAPFPLNMPAVGMATGQAALNVASIAGLESGGPVGNRSIIEVGEGNKPELLQHGGKNFLLAGNGGDVFNKSQLEQVSGDGGTGGGVTGGGGGGITINLTHNFEGDVSEEKMGEFIERNSEAVYNSVSMYMADMGQTL